MSQKILQLTTYLEIGGLERVIFSLSQALKKGGEWEPEVFVYQKKSGEFAPLFEAEKIPLTFYDKGEGFSWPLVFAILKHMRKNGIRVLHSHDTGALIYAVLVKFFSLGRYKIIHTQHSFQHLGQKKSYLYERIFPRFANRLVVVAEDLKKTYINFGAAPTKINVIPNGVDFVSLREHALDKKAAKEKLLFQLSLPRELLAKKWVLYLARMVPVKGQRYALQLWQKLSAVEKKEAALFFVGPLLDKTFIAELKQTLPPDAFIVGPSMDAKLWLQATDIFFSASEFEGMPVAGLEAAAAGCSLFLSEIPGHEIFRGLAEFFPLENLPEASERFARELQQKGTALSSEKRSVLARLEAENGLAKMVARYLDVYRSLD